MPVAKTAEERKARDALILRMFMAGHTMTTIAEHPQVNVSRPMVSKIIARRLAQDTENLEELSGRAFPIYMQQLDMLLSAQFPKAMRGDLKAAEHCRRVLDQKARALGIGTPKLSNLTVDDDDLGDNDETATADGDGASDDGVVVPPARLEDFRRRYGG